MYLNLSLGKNSGGGATASVPTTLVYRYTTSTDAPNTTLPTSATVQLPFESNINGHVDWGDGSASENFFARYNEPRPSHTYAIKGSRESESDDDIMPDTYDIIDG